LKEIPKLYSVFLLKVFTVPAIKIDLIDKNI